MLKIRSPFIYNFKAVCYFVCQNKLLLLPFETKVSG